jgi:outer membrane immunogenic protein
LQQDTIMMGKFIRRSVAGAALLMASPAAHAADMIRKAPPYPVSMSPMWSGAYVGFNVGYAWGSSHATTSVADPGTYFLPASVAQIAAAGAGTVNSKGFTGGVQAGYNWQFGRVVFGIEADANALSLKGSRTASATYLVAPPAAFTITQEVKTDWLATVRPRLGYAFDSILVYGTGGLALTNLKYSTTFSDTDSTAFGGIAANDALAEGSVSKLKLGWTLGAGAEYALSRSWTVKAEYLYVKFSDVSFNSNLTAFGATAVPLTAVLANTVDLSANIVRVGANYRF